MIAGRQAFIREQTERRSAALVPEIILHLACEAVPLWMLTETEMKQSGLPPPFWAFAWPGGQALARHILDEPALVTGRSVLDIGAGGGIASLACLLAGARRVVANDVDQFAAAAIALNAVTNGLGDCLDIVGRDMLDDPVTADEPGFDVVLAGDVCFEQPMSARLLACLRRHAGAGALVLIGDPGRHFRPARGVSPVARYPVPTDPALEDCSIRDTAILQLHAGDN